MEKPDWKKKLVTPEEVLEKIKPGMSIFVSSGAAEPRTLLRSLINSPSGNITDLELIQIISFGELLDIPQLKSGKFRLKTFFSGWLANEAFSEGRIDLIPGFFSQLPDLIGGGQIAIDAAFVQVSPPSSAGYCCLGVAADAAWQAIEQADLVIGEVNVEVPLVVGDTYVPVAKFDYLVESQDSLIHFDKYHPDAVFQQIAHNIASIIEDGSCLAFSYGPIFEALGQALATKKDLGVHSPFITDAVMELVKSGAVTNRKKAVFKGKSLASYALGSKELFDWLDNNPLVEFQGVDKVFNPLVLGKNDKFISIIPSRKVDLGGDVVLFSGKSNIGATSGEVGNFATASRISKGGLSIFALPSRNLEGKCNILLSTESFDEQFGIKEAVDVVVTEIGVANLYGRTVRERAQALIEIAHPEDRKELVELAKEHNLLFKDQIFLSETSHLYQSDINEIKTFKNGISVRFRAIRPSDEEQMRKLFYRFSDESVYYRYFARIKSMPHAKMQTYVNVDYSAILSIVGLIGPPGKGQVIAEARYVKHDDKPYGDIAFVVDDKYKGNGIATYMYKLLARLARERGLQGFTADVLASNTAMMKVLEKEGNLKARLSGGEYEIVIDFNQ